MGLVSASGPWWQLWWAAIAVAAAAGLRVRWPGLQRLVAAQPLMIEVLSIGLLLLALERQLRRSMGAAAGGLPLRPCLAGMGSTT